ncbi:MAG: 50S ribosomal protein L4 [Patescibacteria group bacterium]
MSKAAVYNKTGVKVGEVSLEPKIFGVPVKPQVIQQAVRTQLANSRVAIAHTKTRSEVRGGGKKPWRQKGTGRARHGSIRSPLWKGGAVTFGPRSDRNFSLKMNKKARRQALFMTLTDRANEKNIVIIDSLAQKAIKTKDFLASISKLPLKKTILLALPKADQLIIKSTRNIPFIKTINADSLNVVDVLNRETLLMPKASLEVISKTYLK